MALYLSRNTFVVDGVGGELNEPLCDDLRSALKKRMRVLLLHPIDEVPFEQFVMSKALRKHYATPERLPHCVVVEKMRQRRHPHPRPGERVPFVLVRHKDARAKVFEKAEDPAYVQDQKLPLDLMAYVEQLHNPVCALMRPFAPDLDPMRLFEACHARLTRLRLGVRPITDFFGGGGKPQQGGGGKRVRF